MTLRDDIEELSHTPGSDATHTSKPRSEHPKGWEPGIQFSYEKGEGTVTSPPIDTGSPKWDNILKKWNFDPEKFVIDGKSVEVRCWDAPVGDGEVKTMWYYKGKVKLKEKFDVDQADVDELCKQIRKHRPKKPQQYTGDAAYAVFVADTQIGKERTDAAIERIIEKFDASVERLKELRKSGRPIGPVYLCFMGDLCEAVQGHYANQLFTAELNRRDQEKVMRRLALKMVQELSLHTDKLVVTSVYSNHGQNRGAGNKMVTDNADSVDVAIIESVADITSENPDRYGHVSYILPDGEDCTITLNMGGQTVALTHGHVGATSGDPQNKLEKWWNGQMMGQQPAGDADVLVTAHYHHFRVIRKGSRTHLMLPSLDGGSPWFENQSGLESPPGMVTVVFSENGWDDLKIC